MKVEVKDAPHSQKEITIEIPYENFEQEMEKQTDKIAQKAKIDGFRPGKAPRDVVKKQYLHNIRSEALDATINSSVRDALISNNINPLGQPEVADVKLEDGKPLTFSVFVDVFPTIALEKFEGFEFDKTIITIGEEDVDEALVRFREQYTEWQSLKDSRSLQQGDQAVFDFLGKVDGVPFDGGAAQGHSLEIGSGQFIPGFEEGMVGMALNEVKDVTVTFPAEYHAPNLAGKDAIFTVTLHDIRAKVTPELNDEFAKKVSPHFDTVDKLIHAVKKDLGNEANHYTKNETFTAILEKLIEVNPFDIPNAIVMDQAERMAQQQLQKYYQMGLDPARFGITPEQIMPEMMPEAEKQVKRALLINKIAEDNKFEATEDDIKKEIHEASDLSGRPEEDIAKDVYANEQYMASIKNDVISDKVFDFLQSKNKINEIVMSRKDFEAKMKAQEEARAAAMADETAGEEE